ncbi:Phosphate-specific transport system accessory protein PhoU [Phycisphaerales bacterium]|nr:Phosphate-specific transport system accessory protein PhoU [Phycisphaerales bacterium]
MLEAAFEALFDRSDSRAAWAIAQDDEVDRVDVAIERGCVDLLTDATRQGAELDARHLRAVLMIVKVNNELERAADVAADIAENARSGNGTRPPFPDTFRVMANSVIGIVRDANSAMARNDPQLANIVLQSQHAVAAFKDAVLRDAEDKLAKGQMRPDFAFLLHEIANSCETIADHCTNVAEQTIYLTTGSIVRHMQSRWVELPRPQAG